MQIQCKSNPSHHYSSNFAQRPLNFFLLQIFKSLRIIPHIFVVFRKRLHKSWIVRYHHILLVIHGRCTCPVKRAIQHNFSIDYCELVMHMCCCFVYFRWNACLFELENVWTKCLLIFYLLFIYFIIFLKYIIKLNE